MATYKIAWNNTTQEVKVLNANESPSVGFIVAGEFEDTNGPFKPDLSWVLYHRVRDALYKQGVYDMQRLKILSTPSAPPVFSVSGPATLSRVQGQAFTQQYTSANGTAPVVWSLVNAPAGVTINSSGLLSIANSLAVNTYNFTVRATDAGSVVANRTVALTITAAAVDTRPRYFNAPSNAATVNTTALVTGGTPLTGSAAGGKSGTFTDNNTVAGNYGWYAALASAGAPVFTDVGSGLTGGWDSRGNVTVNGQSWQLWQRNYPQTGGATSVA